MKKYLIIIAIAVLWIFAIFFGHSDPAKMIDARRVIGPLTLRYGCLHLLDSDETHDLIIEPGSNLTTDKTFTLTTGDADRTLTLSGNATLDDWFDQAVKTNSDVIFSETTISGHNGSTAGLSLGSTLVTASAAELNTVADGSTAKNSHTHTLSTGATDVTATYVELNLLDGAVLKHKVIEIGDWNMDSTGTVNIAHGLTFANIRYVQVMIRDDTNTYRYALDYGYGAKPSGYWVMNATNVDCSRVSVGDGGVFDSVNFDSTSYNRGWVIVWYAV